MLVNIITESPDAAVLELLRDVPRLPGSYRVTVMHRWPDFILIYYNIS